MNIPVSEILKSIPGAVGIRLEEELPYTVIRKIGDLELRHYDSFTLARTTADGSYDDSGDVSFRRLAEFIFGYNTEEKKTAMTTPVFMDRVTDGWTMSFYLPEEAAALVPKDPNVIVENHPAKDVAV